MKKIFIKIFFLVLVCFTIQTFAQIPVNILVQISKAEDELRFDVTLEDLLKNPNTAIRKRSVLAAGRIGDERAVSALVGILEKDSDIQIRAAAAFALGEIESIKAADAILKVLQNTKDAADVRARAVEAAGKIAAANVEDEKAKVLSKAILEVLEFEAGRGTQQNRDVILVGITAVLRAKLDGGDLTTAKFLTNTDARIRADAANTLSRLRSRNFDEQLRTMLMSDNDAIAKANAARALGAAEDKDSFDLLLKAAVSDSDSRVRVSAVRSLGNLKNAKAADILIERGGKLLEDYKKSKFTNPPEKNELIEIATTLSRLLPNSNDEKVIKFLNILRDIYKFKAPEVEIAYAKVAPVKYIGLNASVKTTNLEWHELSAQAQAIGELGGSQSLDKSTKDALQSVWKSSSTNNEKQTAPDITIPDYLRAYAQFKPIDLAEVLRNYLENKDVFIRAAAAELLGDQPTAKENVEALKSAFTKSLKTDQQYNDAQLAILDALFKLDKKESVTALLNALSAPDYLVRKKAFDFLQDKDLQKNSSSVAANLNFYLKNNKNRILTYLPSNGTKLGQILNTNTDYNRAVLRKNGQVKAVLSTEKGNFTIDLLPEDAPLTVDNFIKLAKSGYFNGLAIHRVVPNFVMQDGDPRGDGNGGPGWEIRDEINMLNFERGAVGMALSGKNTGGSQWFVTHSPQPHLDGGYTIFGRVNETDMKIVDLIVRGDKILSVNIIEGKLSVKPTKK